MLRIRVSGSNFGLACNQLMHLKTETSCCKLLFFLSFSVQLVSCVYVDYVKRHTGCWSLQLLSLFCLRQGGYKNQTDSTISDCVAPDDTGLAMDCACFTFLVIQYRVFTSDYFKHVVRDHREQSDMASRCVNPD